jgi:hypothetical protein
LLGLLCGSRKIPTRRKQADEALRRTPSVAQMLNHRVIGPALGLPE